MNSNTACHSCGCNSCTGQFCASKVPIFSTLADEQLAMITNLITRRRYKKGQVIFFEGDLSDKFYIINRGKIKTFKHTREGKEQILYILTEGDFIGDLSYQVHAAWLDTRIGKQNNIFAASSPDGGRTWSENKLVYQGPEGKVCPCCRPSIAADKKGNVYVMFRNELKGARDLYLAESHDGGKHFSTTEKLGTGTWLLKQCPMDGGAVSLDRTGNVGTTWRRENTVYYAEPGKAEMKVGEGRASSLVKTSKGNYLAWQQGNSVMVLTPDKLNPQSIGSGIYPRLASMSDERVMCIWESEGKILGLKLD